MNYQIILDNTLKKITDKKNLLLHACCAPCSSYVIEYLSNYFNITILFYNPNIDTIYEYERRLKELERFVQEFKTLNQVKVVSIGYKQEDYLNEIKGLENEKEGGLRCLKCYELRLRKTFEYAKDKHFDYITTTLTISPLKNSKILNEIGNKLEKEYHINYLYSDFKKKDGYKKSIILSREYNLYRQDYCGCIFSKNRKIIK